MSDYMNFRARQAGFRTYADYLASSHWIDFSLSIKAKKCFCCKYRHDLQVHHITYKNLGCETAFDVATVCGRCHVAIHELANSGKPLGKAHLIHRDRIRARNAKRKDRLCKWTELVNKSTGQTLSELHSFLESKGLIFETYATAKAVELGFAKVNDDDSELWSVKRYIAMMQADKKAQKSISKGRPPGRKITELALL